MKNSPKESLTLYMTFITRRVLWASRQRYHHARGADYRTGQGQSWRKLLNLPDTVREFKITFTASRRRTKHQIDNATSSVTSLLHGRSRVLACFLSQFPADCQYVSIRVRPYARVLS